MYVDNGPIQQAFGGSDFQDSGPAGSLMYPIPNSILDGRKIGKVAVGIGPAVPGLSVVLPDPDVVTEGFGSRDAVQTYGSLSRTQPGDEAGFQGPGHDTKDLFLSRRSAKDENLGVEGLFNAFGDPLASVAGQRVTHRSLVARPTRSSWPPATRARVKVCEMRMAEIQAFRKPILL